MTKVIVKEGEPLERALKRFRAKRLNEHIRLEATRRAIQHEFLRQLGEENIYSIYPMNVTNQDTNVDKNPVLVSSSEKSHCYMCNTTLKKPSLLSSAI